MRVVLLMLMLVGGGVWMSMTFGQDRSKVGDAELVLAARDGDLDTLRRGVNQGLGVDQLRGNTTLLIHAASSGSPGAVRWLLEQGADVNLVAPCGWTPLIAAAVFDRVEAAQILLDAGADPAVRSQGGRTALEIARERDAAGMVHLLEDRTGGVASYAGGQGTGHLARR
jgi:uncharacterized protein